MLIKLLRNIKLVLGRCNTKSLRKKLKKEAHLMIEKIKAALEAMNKEKEKERLNDENPFRFILQRKVSNNPLNLHSGKMLSKPEQIKKEKLEIVKKDEGSNNWFMPSELDT